MGAGHALGLFFGGAVFLGSIVSLRLSAYHQTISNKWMEMKLLENTTWCLKGSSGVSNGYTGNTLLDLVSKIVAVTGPINVMRPMRSECPPGREGWGKVTPQELPNYVGPDMDGYSIKGLLAALQKIAGGVLAVDLDMDSYPGVSDDCCPHGPNYSCCQTPQEFFTNNATSLYNCCPPGTICWLEAWSPGAFDAVVNNKWANKKYYCSKAPVVGSSDLDKKNFLAGSNGFFPTMRKIGWQSFCYQTNLGGGSGSCFFPTSNFSKCGQGWRGYSFGQAQYARVGINQPNIHPDSSPYISFSDNNIGNLVKAVASADHVKVLTGIEVQPQNNTSAIIMFHDLGATKQLVAMNYAASVSNFVFPVLGVEDVANLRYDAAYAGTLFATNGICALAKKYFP